MKVEEFDRILRQVEALGAAGAEVNPALFYPPVNKHSGKSRDLPMVEPLLREALIDYLHVRLDKDLSAKPTDRLFLSQKGGGYSPNSLQNHMSLILKRWAGIEGASSHSGRRALMTDIIHHQGKSVKIAQKIAGHVNPATTLIYEEPPEETIAEALMNTNLRGKD